MQNRNYQELLLEKISKAIVAIGVIISIYSLINNRSLWLDEAMLARNIVDKSFYELLFPLDWNQVAPIGFLFVVKILAEKFGYYDWVLRIYPFITYLISIPLFYFFVKQITNSKTKTYLAISLFSINQNILYYSNELKQYSSDIMVTLLILAVFINNFYKKDEKSLWYLTITGTVAIWFSNISVLILFPIALIKFYQLLSTKGNKNIIILYVFWGVSFLLYYALFIHDHPTKSYMLNYWQKSFFPIDHVSGLTIQWLIGKIKMIFGSLIGFKEIRLFTAFLILIGISTLLYKKNITLIVIIFVPVLTHLILSALTMYPFDFRFLLYIIPLLILLFIDGAFFLWNYINTRIFKISILILFIPILLLGSPIVSQIPFQNEEIKYSLEFMNSRIEENDKIYVYYGAYDAFVFYNDSYPNIKGKTVISGKRHYNDWPKYYSDLLEHKGNIWLLFSHVSPFGTENNEENFIINNLKNDNYKFKYESKYHGSSIYKVKL